MILFSSLKSFHIILEILRQPTNCLHWAYNSIRETVKFGKTVFFSASLMITEISSAFEWLIRVIPVKKSAAVLGKTFSDTVHSTLIFKTLKSVRLKPGLDDVNRICEHPRSDSGQSTGHQHTKDTTDCIGLTLVNLSANVITNTDICLWYSDKATQCTPEASYHSHCNYSNFKIFVCSVFFSPPSIPK